MNSFLFKAKNKNLVKILNEINPIKKNIFKNNQSKFRFCSNEKLKEIKIDTLKTEKLDDSLLPDFEERTRNEEVLFCIMHDKFSVKPNKEYRISHVTKEKTDNINKSKDLDVIYYGKYKFYKGKHSIREISTIKQKLINLSNSIRAEFNRKVYPRDYPHSVKDGYSVFSTNHFMSNVIFNSSNFITIQLLINSMGLGISKTSTAVFSAGMNWAIKEGIGQVGNNNSL
jgi:hypothetical protein